MTRSGWIGVLWFFAAAAWAGPSHEVEIEGMTCDRCATRIAVALEALPFVSSARVSYVDGAACISSTDTWDEQTTRKALVAEGFEVVSIKVVDTCERVKVEHGPWGPPGRLDVKVISTADKVKLSEHLVDGKFTVIDFTAPWCGPCHVLARELATYMGQHDDMAVRVINLDSRTARGSFDLPVARQHLSFVVALPYIRVYSPKGKRLYEGGELAEALKIIEGER